MRRVESAARKAESVALRVEAAVRSRDEAIVAAARAGCSYRQISEATGLTFSRVGQIVRAAVWSEHATDPQVVAMSEDDVLRAMREAVAKPSEWRG